MSDKRQPNVVGVRFCKVGKIYHFDASDLENVQLGDIVIVDTARGTQLGEVVQLVNKASETDGGLKKSTGEPTPWILFSVSNGSKWNRRSSQPAETGRGNCVFRV